MSGSAKTKRLGQLSGWGDDQGKVLPYLIKLIVIENNYYNYHVLYNKPTIDIIHLMNYGLYMFINHRTLNTKI